MAETQPQTQEPHAEEPKVQSEETTEEIDPEHEHMDEEQDFVGEFQPKDQLDSHLAVVEEQFRKSFEERFSTQKAKKQFWEDESEMIRSSKVFREVSRVLGYEWQPIFADLMKKFPPEVVAKEKLEIEKQQPIIQGYKALTAWKELSGPSYTIMQLVDVLRDHNMDDVADEVLNILDSKYLIMIIIIIVIIIVINEPRVEELLEIRKSSWTIASLRNILLCEVTSNLKDNNNCVEVPQIYKLLAL